MDTQDPAVKKIPALRTYAKDLEYTRTEKKLPLHHQSEVNVERSSAPKKPPIRKVIENITEEKARDLKSEVSSPIKQLKKNDPIKISAIETKNTAFIANNDDAGSATIITDTKKDRFKLFPAILSSLTSWFSTKKKDRKRKAVPKYSVPDSSHRKGVIQRATSTTGKSVSSDFSSIHERIRQRAEPEEKHELHKIWTPDTEPGYLLLEEPEIYSESNVGNVQITPRKSVLTEIEYEPEEEEVEVWGEPEASPETKPEVQNYPVAEQEVTPVTEQPDAVTQVNVKSAKEKITQSPAQEKVVTKEPIIAPPDRQIIPPIRKRVSRPGFLEQVKILALDTNTLAVFISSFILVLIIIVFAVNYFLDPNRAAVATVADPETISLLQNTRVELVAANNPNVDILRTLQSPEIQTSGFRQIVFVENLITNQLLSPSIIFNSLDVPLEANLLQSIRDVRFGFTKDNQPYILLRISDFEVAKGGLLLWEESIYENINNIFGLTAAPLSNLAKFSDSAFSGRDVRILKNDNNNELLLYGIVDQTVIITKNSIGFRELSILIK